MEIRAKLSNITRDWASGRFNITFEMLEGSIEDIANLRDGELLLALKKWHKRRSRDANALLWACIGEIASALPAMDKWDVYLSMLEKYGKYTYICVLPEAVEAIKAQWRECRVVGEREVEGKKAIEMLCYFGSSTYDAQEFSVLLDGVIAEMKDIGLPAPTSQEMRRSLELWQKTINSGRRLRALLGMRQSVCRRASHHVRRSESQAVREVPLNNRLVQRASQGLARWSSLQSGLEPDVT